MAQAIWCHTVLILSKILTSTIQEDKFKKWGYTIPPPFHLNKKEWAMCFLIWTPVTHIYDYLYYSHVADSCKHLGLLHHPLCCATLTAVDRSQYCQSLLFSLVTFCKKNVGLWHLYAVSVLPNPTPISEPTDFHYTWYEYFVIGIHTKL